MSTNHPKIANPPHSVWSGSFQVFGVELKCHNLSDGSRIIEVESVEQMFKAMRSSTAVNLGDINEFAKWQKGK